MTPCMVCMVTDGGGQSIADRCEAAVRAGVDMIQVREPDLDAAALAALVTSLVRLTRGTGTRVVVNDRLDVALACGADGVHLRGDSIPPASARVIAPPGLLIGRSVRRLDEAMEAAPSVDYLIAGTVFPTSSKAGLYNLLGIEGLTLICEAVPVPVLAIGGVTPDRFAAIAEAGAAGVAAIGLFKGEGRPVADVVHDARTTWKMHAGRSRGLTP
jgi:thiamine-phosphate pyrophosphorylase